MSEQFKGVGEMCSPQDGVWGQSGTVDRPHAILPNAGSGKFEESFHSGNFTN